MHCLRRTSIMGVWILPFLRVSLIINKLVIRSAQLKQFARSQRQPQNHQRTDISSDEHQHPYQALYLQKSPGTLAWVNIIHHLKIWSNDLKICCSTFCFLHTISVFAFKSFRKSCREDGLVPRTHSKTKRAPSNVLIFQEVKHEAWTSYF